MKPNYKVKNWDTYARSHASVITSFQWDLYQEAVQYMVGDVVDYGCGTAKLAPILDDNQQIDSYTGVDFSPEMVKMARWIVAQLTNKAFTIKQQKIEQTTGLYSSAVSIHSYYSWINTQVVLSNIYQCLKKEGVFVLVTPNPKLDMAKLIEQSNKELLAHPDAESFRQLNFLFEKTAYARFISMDALILDCQTAGFKIIECHQRHYLGGVNFLVLRK